MPEREVRPPGIRSAVRAYGRTGLAFVLFAGTTLTLIVTAPGGAAADPTPFFPGTGTATAHPIELKPSTGGLGYTITLDTSDAEFEGNTISTSLAKAQSQTLNLGAIGTSLTSTQCNGSAAPVQPSQLPQSAAVQSGTGPSSQTITVAGTYGGSGAGAGIEQASITNQPLASATTRGANFDVAGAIDISGSDSSAVAQVIGGNTRDVTSTADVGRISLLGGLVVLGDLHWGASQQTTGNSTTPTASGTFTVGSLVVSGTALPTASPSQLASSLAIANTALAPSGFNITLPEVIETPDTHNGNGSQTQVTALTIGIDNSALGQEVVGSQLTTIQPLRNALDDAILGASCTYGTELLLADIGLGAVSGGGDLDLNLGSATVNLNSDPPVDPFGNFGFATASGPIDSVTTSGGSPGVYTPGSAGTPGTPSIPATPGIPGTSSSPTLGSTATSSPSSATVSGTESLGPTIKTAACRSLSPAGGSCSGGGAALPIGIAALAFLVATFAWDVVRQRRRRLTIGGTS